MNDKNRSGGEKIELAQCRLLFRYETENRRPDISSSVPRYILPPRKKKNNGDGGTRRNHPLRQKREQTIFIPINRDSRGHRKSP